MTIVLLAQTLTTYAFTLEFLETVLWFMVAQMVTGKDAHSKEPQEPAAAKHAQLKFVYEVKLQIIFFSFSIFFFPWVTTVQEVVEMLEGRKISPWLFVQGFTRRSHTICNECAELFAVSIYHIWSQGSIFAIAIDLFNKDFSKRSEGKTDSSYCDPLISQYVIFIDFILPPRG